MTGQPVTDQPGEPSGQQEAFVAGMVLLLPANWWLLPLDDKTRQKAIARLVDERVTAQPEIAPRRTELVSLFRRVARRAADNDAVLCAQYAWGTDAEAVGANLLVLVDPFATSPEEGATTDGASLLSALVEGAQENGGQVLQQGLVELPGPGPAVRLHSRVRSDVGAGRLAELVSVQYAVPVPGTRSTALLTFTSPNLGYEAELVRLFDAITSTLAFADPEDRVEIRDQAAYAEGPVRSGRLSQHLSRSRG